MNDRLGGACTEGREESEREEGAGEEAEAEGRPGGRQAMQNLPVRVAGLVPRIGSWVPMKTPAFSGSIWAVSGARDCVNSPDPVPDTSKEGDEMQDATGGTR